MNPIGAGILTFFVGMGTTGIIGLVIEWRAARKPRRKVRQRDYYRPCTDCTLPGR